MPYFNEWIEDVRSNGINVEAHVRLFIREVTDYMTAEDFNELRLKYFSDDRREKLVTLWNKDEQMAKEVLFKTVTTEFKNHPDAITDFLAIIVRCKTQDRPSYEELRLTNLATMQHYARLFATNYMDGIAMTLEPEPIIEYLGTKNVEEYDSLIVRVNKLIKEKDYDAAACQIIRGLPFCTDAKNSSHPPGLWFYDFVEACKTHGYTSMIPRFIDPDIEEELMQYKAKKEIEQRGTFEVENSDLVLDDTEPTEPRSQKDYLNARIMTCEIDFEPIDYFLRPYQNELVSTANSGRNTIICAPTGSGKTLMATDIVKKHLMNMNMDNRVARCVMLVPTVPLVDQQACHFVEYLGGTYWIDGLSGCENTNNRAQRFLACDIVVMTPQILINMMNSVLRSERIYFIDITMLIFDECHHCSGDHPYKILMDMLAEKKIANKPQIIGLTASLGVGRGKTCLDIHQAREHMLTLCSHLTADTISTVRHQLDNLRSHVQPPVDKVIKAKRPARNDFVLEIKATMSRLQREMEPLLNKIISKKMLSLTQENIVFPDPDNPGQYQSMVGSLKKQLQRLSNPEMRLQLVRSIDHLSHYFHAIQISDLLPNSYGLGYLNSKMSAYVTSSDKAQLDSINRHFLDVYNDLRENRLERYLKAERVEDKEILQLLCTTLYDQFIKEPDSRALIFVATRATAQRLSDYLGQLEIQLPMFYKNKTVGYMVSSNQSGIMGGQSAEEQRRMCEDFRKGKIKVLVVTSVAEEGVNITACNLIIKYNNVGSERTMIQRRGRARQKNSLSVLLALDTGVELQEFLNMQKEAMMMRCIEDLQERDDNTLRRLIKTKGEQLAKLREDDRKRELERRSHLEGKKYKLCCRSCSNLICHSTHVRSVANSLFLCCDPSVWKRSRNETVRRPTKDQFYTKCARWLCSGCGQEWGQVVKYSNVFLPQITAGNFTMERQDQEEPFGGEMRQQSGALKWNRIQEGYFNVEPLSMKNILDMFSSLLKFSPNGYKTLEEQDHLANKILLAKMEEKRAEKRTKLQMFLEE